MSARRLAATAPHRWRAITPHGRDGVLWFRQVKIKPAAFNLADSRAQVDFDGTYEVFQVGCQIQATIEAKFP